MIKHRNMTGLAAFLGMLVLVLDSKTTVSGAREGIALCVNTVIPSLLPFFMLSGIIIHSFMGTHSKLLQAMGRIWGIPRGTESLLIPAYLGGYPTGAASISQLERSGAISKPEAARLMAFCNNAGPSFLFGILGPMFQSKAAPWLLWGIHILSSLCCAMIFRNNEPQCQRTDLFRPLSMTAVLQNSIRSMAAVCGWVIIFRVFITFLDRWLLWMLPLEFRVIAIGTLELSNGCLELANISDPKFRFLFSSAFLSIGGICVWMQVISAAQGIALRWFLWGKLLQTIISILFSLILVSGTNVSLVLGILILVPILRKTRNNSSIPGKAGV